MEKKNKPILCWVTDRRQLPANRSFAEAVEVAIAAGVQWIQIREKDLPAKELLALVRDTVARCANAGTRVIVNDRLDVGLAARAHGLHLGEASIPVREVRAWLGSVSRAENFLTGVSCHSVDAVRSAEGDGADYAIFGPVFDTPSKRQYGPPRGLDALKEACQSVRIPVLAIGGVTRETVVDCVSAGAAGVAAIRMFQPA